MKQRPYLFFILTIISALLILSGRLQAQQSLWAPTGSLGTARADHTATLLTDGKVLVVGGDNGSVLVSTAELYDPSTGQWNYVHSPALSRTLHKAVRLNNGKVLIIGGMSDDFNFQLKISLSGEIYDPQTDNWSSTGVFNIPRFYPEVVLLADGKVLMTGGYSLGVTNAAEIYNPDTNAWRAVRSMNEIRAGHSSTLLPNEKVLVAGGIRDTAPRTPNIRSAEIYDPATDRWSVTGEMPAPQAPLLNARLGNSKILFTSGVKSSLYDLNSGTWSITGALNIPRDTPTLTLLPSGKILVVGGRDNSPKPIGSVEIYDPDTETWESSSSALGSARVGHTATLLQNGKVLVVGGSGISGALRSAELFDSNSLIVTTVSAANYSNSLLAPASIASAFGVNLAATAQSATGLPLPTELGGVKVRITDRLGTERNASLFYVSPNQINYQIPSGTALGLARVTISSGATGVVEIREISPGLFSADSTGTGYAAAVIQRVKSNGEQTYEPIVKFDVALNRFVALPIDVSDPTEKVFLAVFGTGIRGRSSLSNVNAKVGVTDVEVVFAGEQGDFAGVDQINLRLPSDLKGTGETIVNIVVDGVPANSVNIAIR